jgi:glycosyltransferase involved in cell wall biosynthesis
MGVNHTNENTEALEKAVRSILNQTLSDFEFLICDDGSGMCAISLLDRMSAEDKRIRLIRTGKASNHAHKLNLCLSTTDSKYIARQDDDDISQPQRLEKQILFLEQHPDVDFVGCNAEIFDDCGIYKQRLFPQKPTVKDFLFVQPFLHPAIIFRAESLKNIGGYDESPRRELCEDYDLLLRLYKAGKQGYNLNDFLFSYHVSRGGQTKRKMHHRVNEMITRYERFKELGLLPKALPYVIKPILVGVVKSLLRR